MELGPTRTGARPDRFDADRRRAPVRPPAQRPFGRIPRQPRGRCDPGPFAEIRSSRNPRSGSRLRPSPSVEVGPGLARKVSSGGWVPPKCTSPACRAGRVSRLRSRRTDRDFARVGGCRTALVDRRGCVGQSPATTSQVVGTLILGAMEGTPEKSPDLRWRSLEIHPQRGRSPLKVARRCGGRHARAAQLRVL